MDTGTIEEWTPARSKRDTDAIISSFAQDLLTLGSIAIAMVFTGEALEFSDGGTPSRSKNGHHRDRKKGHRRDRRMDTSAIDFGIPAR